ncbi:MAG: hypothetical protein KBG46_13475, partial [Paracoccus sp.]|nr:hypothetical protein [Paracoccus sp. (in: a-proteobacteria)]
PGIDAVIAAHAAQKIQQRGAKYDIAQVRSDNADHLIPVGSLCEVTLRQLNHKMNFQWCAIVSQVRFESSAK